MRKPIPRPASLSLPIGPLRTWIDDLTAYLQSAEQAKMYGQEIVVLPGWTDAAKATGNGVIMFHPTLGVPVVSVNGVWYRLTLGAPV